MREQATGAGDGLTLPRGRRYLESFTGGHVDMDRRQFLVDSLATAWAALLGSPRLAAKRTGPTY